MFQMTFYCTKEADGTIHVQNAIMGALGQHHVHTPEDFEVWRKDTEVKWLKGTAPCDCGLKAGEVRGGG